MESHSRNGTIFSTAQQYARSGTDESSTTASPTVASVETATATSALPEATALRGTPASTEWEAHKDIINDLYMEKNLNLNEVVERMRTYGLHAT